MFLCFYWKKYVEYFLAVFIAVSCNEAAHSIGIMQCSNDKIKAV